MKEGLGLLMALGFLLSAAMSAKGAEPDEAIRAVARQFAALEANDLSGYCAVKQSPSYAAYLARACQSAVQNKLKQPQDCSQESIAQQAKVDATQCLAMTPAEFKEKVRLGREGKAAFIKAMTEQGIDGERLLQEEQHKAEARKRMELEILRATCCAKPAPEDRRRVE